MPGSAAKVVISERQQEVLRQLSTATTAAKRLTQRDAIVLLPFTGPDNAAIAPCQRPARAPDAAVAPALPRRLGHVGHPELDVQPEAAAELLPGDDVPGARPDLQGAAFHELPAGRAPAVPLDPAVQALAVEQDDGPRGRGHAL